MSLLGSIIVAAQTVWSSGVGASVGLGGLTPRLSRWAQLLNDQGAFGLEDLVTIARAVE